MLPLMRWAPAAYDTGFGYVSAHGAYLLDLLDPQPGERVIDLGCGTGALSVEIAERGADVLGIDGSPEMIAAARTRFPELSFVVASGLDFNVVQPYDAVFSNAALHWMSDDPDAVIARVYDALEPGGRFVAEMGGAGSCAHLTAAMRTAWREFDLCEPVLPMYFPSPAEYAARLEQGGFTVRLLEYFDRPTRLTDCRDGAADWVRMFAAGQLADVPKPLVEPLLRRVNQLAAPALRRETGWVADYVRLRFAAVRTAKDGSARPAPVEAEPAGRDLPTGHAGPLPADHRGAGVA
jgi:trans-aconitate methyltransferase